MTSWKRSSPIAFPRCLSISLAYRWLGEPSPPCKANLCGFPSHSLCLFLPTLKVTEVLLRCSHLSPLPPLVPKPVIPRHLQLLACSFACFYSSSWSINCGYHERHPALPFYLHTSLPHTSSFTACGADIICHLAQTSLSVDG
jgi:hypothetical protein